MVFARLPIVFFIVGNHGDISRFLQDSINQMETIMQQQTSSAGWQTYFVLFAYSIDWLLTHRLSDFQVEWNTRFRTLPIYSKLLPLLDRQNPKYA
jgi:hypothetical protein